MNGAQAWLVCGHCGHTFPCREETIVRRQQKGKWLPYCSTPCTDAALRLAVGGPPPGSRLAHTGDHAAVPAITRAHRERPVLQRPEANPPNAPQSDPVAYFRRATLPRWKFGPEFKYSDYLQTPRWRALSAKVRDEVGHCEVCGTTDHLEAHHAHYDTLGHEMPDDLVVLCRRCHRRWHEIVRAGSGSLGSESQVADVAMDVEADLIRLVRRRPRQGNQT